MRRTTPTPTLRRFLGAAFLAVAATASAQPIEAPIVFVKQVPLDFQFATISDIFGNFQGYYPPAAQPVGGGLFRLDPDGTAVRLSSFSNAAVRDPEVSSDARRVIFSMKIGGHGKWQIWEVGVDGSGLRRISADDRYNDLDPAWLGDGRIVFTTDRLGWADGYENLPSAQLAIMRGDGSGVRVLKSNMAGHFNPLVGADGMIYFSQWDFHDRRRSIGQNNSNFDVNRFLLWKIFADGSGLDHPHFGAHTVYDFSGGYVEIRQLPGTPERFLGILADEFFTFGGGSIVRLEPHADQDRDAPIFVTENVFMVEAENVAGRWRSPYPLADGRILASWSPGPVYDRDDLPRPHWELVVMAADGSAQTRVYRDPELWSWQPVEVRERPVPRLAPGEARPDFPYAVLNALDVTLRGRNGGEVVNGDFQPGIDPGEAVSVRVWRQDLRSANFYDDFPDHADPDVGLLGTAPVHPDGSFAVIVPAGVPVQWELLDGAGEVLVRERFAAELVAGEIRTCGGCHAPHDGRPGSRINQALASPTNLTLQDVDRDGNGVVDLIEFEATAIHVDGFESGNLAGWIPVQ